MLFLRLLCRPAAMVLMVQAAQAAPLTCAQYKDRLNGAVLVTGAKDVATAEYRLAFDSPTRGKRFAWTDAGMEGSLTCGVADQFEEFSIALAFDTKATFAAMISRFITLSGAAVCALASDGASACANFGRAMLQTGLEQMGQSYNHGSKAPSGLVDQDLFPGAKAELTAAPTRLTFLVGPGPGGSLDDARQPLPGPARSSSQAATP